MTLTRPLASIDIETTGLDAVEDRIISFGVSVLHPDGTRTQFEQFFNPGMPISPGAMAAHGITDAMVADKPPFKDFAAKIHRGLQGKDLLGYNLRSLDLPMLDEEFRRCGLSLDLGGGKCWCVSGPAGAEMYGSPCPHCGGTGQLPTVSVIDAFGIFAKKEPRDLSAAVEKYCGRKHEGAHGAGVDASATLDVLIGQRAHYEDVGVMTLAELAAYSRRDELDFVDLSGKLYRDADGDVCFNFGQKTRGKKVRDDMGFASWVLGKNFPGSVHDALREELGRLEEIVHGR